MTATQTPPIEFTVSDASGQKVATVSEYPRDATVGELVNQLLADLGLPKNDAEGRPLSYQARLDREGRNLRESERVDATVQDRDHVVLFPNIDAG